MAAPIAICWHHLWLGHGRNNFWLVLVQRSVAPPAKVVGSTELNQQAMIATDNFPGIYRGKCGGHLGVGVARAGASPGTKKRKARNLVPTCRVICGTTPVDVKINCGLKTKCLVRNPKPAGENPEKTGKKT